MDALLRYNYYIDNMPIDDVTGPETSLQLGVMEKVAYPYNKHQIDPLMDEINNSFIRLQNDVLFRKMLKNNKESQKMFTKELSLDFKKLKFYPEFGRIQLKK